MLDGEPAVELEGRYISVQAGEFIHIFPSGGPQLQSGIATASPSPHATRAGWPGKLFRAISHEDNAAHYRNQDIRKLLELAPQYSLEVFAQNGPPE